MPSKRLASIAVLCLSLAAMATACSDDTKTTAAATVTPSTPSGSASAPASSPAVQGLAVDTLSGAEIAKQAQAATAALTSVKIDGSVTNDGSSTTLQLAADRKGNCAGTVSVPATGRVDILRTSAQVWLKPDAVFWKQLATQKGGPRAGAMAAELFKGRYLTGGQNDATVTQTASMCDLVDSIAKDDDGTPSTYTKGSAGTTNGVKTLSLVATDADGVRSTMYIATEGKPYLVRVERTDSPQTDHMDLSDFDKPVTVQAPPADTVIDYSAFQDKLKTA
ncbi:hypothetical protein OHV05_00160 [Kitasatospora sp. NBC_00070]|uniref:hypothetical protein n=1 Tax=Kitasatospora sp. NBC_00070 TaxID=2975962 RepID=UPI00324CD566